jgi:hypothetical protein
MLEKIGRIAERAATNVSRRQFLGCVGRGAMALAAAAGGLLAVAAEAQGATVCGANSHYACRGKTAGQWCALGTRSGICVGSPACTCRASNGGRGGRGGR